MSFSYYINTPEMELVISKAGYTKVTHEQGTGHASQGRTCFEANHVQRTFKLIHIGAHLPACVFIPRPVTDDGRYVNDAINQNNLFACGYRWASGGVALDLEYAHKYCLVVSHHGKSFYREALNGCQTIQDVWYNNEPQPVVHVQDACKAQPVQVNVAVADKPAVPTLELPNDYEFVARSLTVEQWKGFCLGTTINDKLNHRETVDFFSKCFNQYKELCRG